MLRAVYELSGTPYDALELPPRLRLVFDPRACEGLERGRSSKAKTRKMTRVVRACRWPAPRSTGGWGAYVAGFTTRGLHDIGTCVKYEQSTPRHMRLWSVSPQWAAWLMGFPPAYTDAFLAI
jgi:hypothetical protein